MSDLRERLAALPPDKRALFEKMLKERERAEHVFPLAVMQQGMWFLEELRPNNPAYVVPGALRIRGDLDVRVLTDALNEIVRRHEALRTTFQLRDGRPAQVVRNHLAVEVPETDLRGAGTDDDALAELMHAELYAEPFDLAAGPLLRVRLLRVADDERILVLAMHHLVSDRWSLGVLITELSALYEAFLDGRGSPLAEPTIQYGDFSTWQQQQMERGKWADGLTYWRDHLAGAPAAIALPTDRPRPPVQGFNGASLPFELPGSLTKELTELGRRHGATSYMTLLAVFQLLLHRHSNQDDVVVGVPTAVRGRPEIEQLIGYFVNTLPIRLSLAGDPTFGEVLERVRDACLGAYAHQEVPFELVVADLNSERDLSRSPIYQVSFSYGREPVPTFAMAGMELTRLPLRSEGARFDLELQAFEVADGVNGWFEYDRELFDESTVARFSRHLRRLAELVVARPDAPVAELELLDEAERRAVLDLGVGERTEWPGRGAVHECFEEAARRTPDAEAVRFEGRATTYAELNRRANRLAHRLVRLGVGRDTLVGVGMERSTELVVALLAVLKAGGAYVPLDPGYPQGRLEFMLKDAQVPVLLTQRRVLERLPVVEAEALCVEELEAGLAAERDDDPRLPVDGEDLAYVIYTSGSTGTPKGVMNVHAAIRNRLLWMQDAHRLRPGDRVLQKTPFSFDVSVWEFFWPLMTGATLVVARPEGHKDARYLVDTIRSERITTAHFVPSMLQVFLREPGVEECTGLRQVMCSGEALPRELAQRFLELLPAALHNLYGPTEAAVDVTSWTCARDGDPRPVPIGRPIANTRVHVLDRDLRPVPVGVPGELHIGGRNLARGYLNRPELTAERFVEHPLSGEPGGRLYRTGDLVRLREDGALEYLGRLDHQVKLRGFRIELGEIESLLAQHERVGEAVVTARGSGDDVRLVAYLTGDERLTPGEAAGYLRQQLPEYMVPSAFVVLPELPLTPNGKVDRAALPEPDHHRPELRTPYVAPRDDLESSIAALWCEVLEVDRVGADDNFFDLGGHSLRMSGLRVRLAETLGIEVSMVELFQYPTVGSLAAFLNRPGGSRSAPATGAAGRARSRRQSQDQRQQVAARRARSRKQ